MAHLLTEAASLGPYVQNAEVFLVPTMGALHTGHLSLVEEARRRLSSGRQGCVVVSVFVNPTQFGPGEDFVSYPRDLDHDCQLASQAGADIIFAPTVSEMYPDGHATTVTVKGPLTTSMCGAHRPRHFDGVATVVTKLFGQVRPKVALFGRKDYQQLKVIERLTKDLNLGVEIVGVPTVREHDGLAMSSRNAYLSKDERQSACALARGLHAACRLFASRGPTLTAGAVSAAARAPLDQAVDAIDYLTVCDPDTLEERAPDADVGPRALVAMAARLGKTRLIDNMVLGEDTDPL